MRNTAMVSPPFGGWEKCWFSGKRQPLRRTDASQGKTYRLKMALNGYILHIDTRPIKDLAVIALSQHSLSSYPTNRYLWHAPRENKRFAAGLRKAVRPSIKDAIVTLQSRGKIRLKRQASVCGACRLVLFITSEILI